MFRVCSHHSRLRTLFPPSHPVFCLTKCDACAQSFSSGFVTLASIFPHNNQQLPLSLVYSSLLTPTLHLHNSFSQLLLPLLPWLSAPSPPLHLLGQRLSSWPVKIQSFMLSLMLWCCRLLLCLPVDVKFQCSSPSCIPCPPPVKWLEHYTACRAPSCRTASSPVRLSIARAGSSPLEQQSDSVHASVSVPESASVTNKCFGLHLPVVLLWHTFSRHCWIKKKCILHKQSQLIKCMKKGSCLFPPHISSQFCFRGKKNSLRGESRRGEAEKGCLSL